MSSIFSASIGKKLIMSISGLFLIVFLLVHLGINLLMLVSADAYNAGAHFMATNPAIKIMEPLLALGFVIHILYATILTLQNQKARPENYSTVNQSESSTWPSRNMYVLGGLVLTFLVIHIINFYWKIKVLGGHDIPSVIVDGVEMHDTYWLVAGLFKFWWFDVIYVIGAIFLGLHLSHAFWSAFQTLGLSNIVWRKRLHVIGQIYTYLIAIGFAIIPIYFLITG
ncbi:MAG: succinate dehydrogenase cytochrome b subunit [Bacteroidales bacterium]|nr:succinate dehydrogenase cytochrome b subunit [Bacteroidales bacterium]MCF8455931.1 succinate dehydrogenase cytochrome b subunit [Bacteroidales bacterium]